MDKILKSAHADADQDGRFGLQDMGRGSIRIQHRDAEHFRASVPEPVIDIGNGSDNFGGEIWPCGPIRHFFVFQV